MIPLAIAFAVALWAAPVWAADCYDTTYDSNRYTICETDLKSDSLQLFLNNEDGVAYGHFSKLNATLAEEGKTLVFATNAGMYHPDRSPVGLYIQDGTTEKSLVTRPGPGNFGLLPNGVFCLRDGRADVFETLTYLDSDVSCTSATQSGPMLVIDGELHPRFLPDSTSYYIRNGVGTSRDGQKAIFAISRNAVTFYQFASLFRDYLKMPNALYFDGNISRLYAPEVGRSDVGFAMGPIIGVVTEAEK